mgnify:CR=1 FL=1
MSVKNPVQNVLIIGADIYGKVISEIIRAEERHTIVGFLDDTPAKKNTSFCSLKILGDISQLTKIVEDYRIDLVYIGIGDGRARNKIAAKLIAQGVPLGSCIHPSSVVSPSARIGNGVIIDALCYVGPDVVIEDGVSIWPHCTISHNCIVGAFSSVMPSVTMAGHTKVPSLAKVKCGSVWPAHSLVASELQS